MKCDFYVSVTINRILGSILLKTFGKLITESLFIVSIQHICFLSSMHPALDKRVFDKEAVSLASAGFQVTHLCPGVEKSFSKDGVKVETYTPPAGIKGRLLQFFRLYKMAKDIDADAYHCNEVDSWIVGVWLKIFKRKKCIFDVHEHYPSTFAESRFPKIVRPLIELLIKIVFQILLPFTDKLVLAKNSVSKDFYCSENKKLVVKNYSPKNVVIERKPISKKQGPLHLVHLGLFGRLRGWPQLLDALALLDDVDFELNVIGEINDGSEPDFLHRTQELAIADKVKLMPWMPFDEAFHLLQSYDVGLILFQPGTQNHVYAMPHKMFDYMNAGLAVILPDFAEEVAPVISQEKCGVLIDPSSPQSIADTIRGLAEDRELCIQMGERGHAAVQKTYNWEAESNKLISMYKAM